MSKIEVVPGSGLRLIFDGDKCIHSRNCVLSRPDVFVPNVEGEWLHPEKATTAEIIELAHDCPSGTISFERTDGGPGEQPPMVNVIRVRENGPLAVHAELSLGPDTLLRATLCRCGASGKKPFCDGSHAAASFSASGEAAPRPDEELASRSGRVTIKGVANGPLLIAGPVEIVTGTGHTIVKTAHAALCRCGQSGSKPFCDGAHAKVGFTAAPV
ncbi:MAG: CDGSH iron-sulfur domain-containing protein [Rhodoplanes sp.]|uniref:CDGSH iron-sulfur domain-containing protein n=1 Tax=Rhodoplanes sp. TaxID=1968906 RepID=UPI0017BC6330|nr:CDGSH iron-sulfur domain-containing protein [Rhodoplanes sp.]NVO16551.1 CDGSH iron-sulfur domain-containing protein [Rhodoplanes sp.]